MARMIDGELYLEHYCLIIDSDSPDWSLFSDNNFEYVRSVEKAIRERISIGGLMIDTFDILNLFRADTSVLDGLTNIAWDTTFDYMRINISCYDNFIVIDMIEGGEYTLFTPMVCPCHKLKYTPRFTKSLNIEVIE